VSALSGEGLDQLLRRFEAELTRANIHYRLTLLHADGEGLAWVYRHAQVLERHDGDEAVELTLAIDPQAVGRFRDRFTERQFVETTG
jgi:GTP-binding protein HflX